MSDDIAKAQMRSVAEISDMPAAKAERASGC
jgi:hypothetical protein